MLTFALHFSPKAGEKGIWINIDKVSQRKNTGSKQGRILLGALFSSENHETDDTGPTSTQDEYSQNIEQQKQVLDVQVSGDVVLISFYSITLKHITIS